MTIQRRYHRRNKILYFFLCFEQRPPYFHFSLGTTDYTSPDETWKIKKLLLEVLFLSPKIDLFDLVHEYHNESVNTQKYLIY